MIVRSGVTKYHVHSCEPPCFDVLLRTSANQPIQLECDEHGGETIEKRKVRSRVVTQRFTSRNPEKQEPLQTSARILNSACVPRLSDSMIPCNCILHSRTRLQNGRIIPIFNGKDCHFLQVTWGQHGSTAISSPCHPTPLIF